MANQLQVYREGDIISTFNIDEGTIFIDKLQLERKITCPVSSKDALQLEEGDYITHDGEVYIINNLPDFEKDGGKLQKSYNIVFESEFYLLLDTFVINDFQQKEFPKYGTAEDHLNLIFANANRNDTGWSIGEVDATGSELINYNWTYVRTALNEIADTFKLEWSFTGRELRMVSSIGADTDLTFEVGRGKGLHQIKRSKDTSKSVLTRVFGVGGTRNIDYTYRNGVEKNLIFDGRYVETPGVTAGTERVREGKYTNEELYPRFDGTITGVVVHKDGAGLITDVVITDTAIDFDINAHLQEGEKALVSFRTGALTGLEFEINSYNHATKAIELIPFADTNGYVLPNDLNLAVIGDQFTLLNLRMPAAYIATWEAKLRTETLQYLEDNRKARMLFGVIPDERHLRANNIQLKVGDRGTVIESDAQVNEILRFTEISYPLVNKFKVTAVIGNEIRYDRVVKLFADTIQTRKDVQTIDRRSAELAKRGVQNLRAFESSIFDTDGKLKEERIDVGVLSAILGIFGAKSQNFKLNRVYITDNYQGNASKVFISGGELIHFEMANEPGGNIWTMTSLNADVPVAASLYYVYAKCSRTAQVGSWVVSTAQIKPQDEPGYYHFLTGVVYPVLDGWRNSDFTNGIADINGNRLKIGKVVSRDGLTGFDLDAGEIFGKIVFRAAGGGLKNVSDVDAAALSAVNLATTAQGVADAANTTAIAAQTAATNAQTAANTAQTTANTANTLLADISNDNLLTPGEKQDVLKEWQIIQGEKASVEGQALTYAVSSSAYTTAYNNLNTYVTPLLANLTVNSAIVGTTFRSTFKAYYDAKIALLKLVTDKAKTIADTAQTAANTAQTAANTAQSTANAAQTAASNAQTAANTANGLLADISNDNLLTPSEKQDVLKEWQIIQGEKAYIEGQAATFSVPSATYTSYYNALNTYVLPLVASLTTNSTIVGTTFRTNFKNYYDAKIALLKLVTDKAKGLADAAQSSANTAQSAADAAQTAAVTAQNTANTAQTAANTAQSSANTANALLADIANDNLLVPSEKQDVLKEWQIIQSEYTVVTNQAITYALNRTAYTNAYNSLNSYITPLLASITVNSVIVGTTFRSTFKAYYDAKVALLKAVSDAAKVLADNAQTAANNVQANLSALSAGLGGMAYENAVELAKLGSTIVEGGYIKGDLIEVSTLIVRGNLETTSGALAKAAAAEAAAKAAAAIDATNKVNNIIVGAKNLMKDSSFSYLPIGYSSNGGTQAVEVVDGISVLRINAVGSGSGLYSGVGSFFTEVLQPSTEYTVSYDVRMISYTANPFNIWVGSENSSTIAAPRESVWRRVSSTFTTPATNVSQRSIIYSSGAGANSFYIKNVKIERGNKATDWTPAPEDVQAQALQAATAAETAAKAYAAAQDNLKEISTKAYADGKVTAEEARAIADATAKLNEAKADATAKANAAELAAKNAAAIDATTKADAAKALANTAQTAANTANQLLADISNDNLLTPSEKQDVLKEWQIIQGEYPIVAEQALTYGVDRVPYMNSYSTLNWYLPPLIASMTANSAIVGTTFRSTFKAYYDAKISLLKAVTDAANSKIDNIQVGGTNLLKDSGIVTTNTGYPIRNYLLTTPIAEGEIVTVTIWGSLAAGKTHWGLYNSGGSVNLASLLVGSTISTGVWRVTFPWKIAGVGNTFMSVYPMVQGTAGNSTITKIKLERGNKGTDWSPAIEDVDKSIADAQAAAITSANATAESIATSKANIAQAAAISAAANDATTKANNAKAAAEAASNAYATTAANSAASAAQVAAAADASNKANAAKVAAEATAAAAQTALTNSLKSLAYQDVVELSKLGSTVISGGKLTNALIDTNYLKANVINAAYITALDIVAKTLAATSGTIAGFSIDGNGIVNESVYKNGVLQSGLGNARFVASKKFYNSSNVLIGNKDLAFGSYAIPGYGETQNSLGFIENGEPGKVTNTALILSAYGASNSNVALRIEAGDIVVKSHIGSTMTQNIGGGYGMRFVNGIFVGTIPV